MWYEVQLIPISSLTIELRSEYRWQWNKLLSWCIQVSSQMFISTLALPYLFKSKQKQDNTFQYPNFLWTNSLTGESENWDSQIFYQVCTIYYLETKLHRALCCFLLWKFHFEQGALPAVSCTFVGTCYARRVPGSKSIHIHIECKRFTVNFWIFFYLDMHKSYYTSYRYACS